MQLRTQVKKYLDKQSLSNWNLEQNKEKLFSNIIVIPALAEYKNTKLLLDSLTLNSKQYLEETLIIFVVNNLASHSVDIKETNSKLLIFLRNYLHKENSSLTIGVIDASTTDKTLPEKDGGVGLARKIGMDLALNLFNYESKNKKILICLDADCTVSENYLETIVAEFNQNNFSAGYVNFEHKLPKNEEDQKAIINYEIFLRHYVAGLQYANSPYGFHTIGSTMICDFESYIKIGGMNKRKAAEDFYFMEKLAKVSNINRIQSATVYPSSRGSWRVPFGTGQRVNRYLSQKQNEYLLYSHKSFEVLKEWLNIFHNKENTSSDHYLAEAKRINISLYNFFVEQKFEKSWGMILRNSKTELQIEKQKRIWMDGFKTLKLVHYLRDNEFPQGNMFDTLDILFNKVGTTNSIQRNEKIPSIEVQLKYLKILREIESVHS
ncbi:MAG: glycosyltransferase family 2 protein [Ignavibacteriae bacterium]|nr:glycosyltransferase family 2 protein [Ignavibacteriota bacterium]